jgi:hypothetical protein
MFLGRLLFGAANVVVTRSEPKAASSGNGDRRTGYCNTAAGTSNRDSGSKQSNSDSNHNGYCVTSTG